MLSGVIDRARSSAKSMVLIYGWALTRTKGCRPSGIGLGYLENRFRGRWSLTVASDYFDYFDVDRGANSLLKGLRMHKAGDIDGAKTELSWLSEKFMSIDVFLLELFKLIGDKELSKLMPALYSVTGKKVHSRLVTRTIVKKKTISAAALIDYMGYAGIKGQMMAPVIEELGIDGYFEALIEFKKQGLKIQQLNAAFFAGPVVRLKDGEFREFIRRHLDLGFPLGAFTEIPLVELPDAQAPEFTRQDIESEDWLSHLYLTPPAKARRELMALVWKYLDEQSEVSRGEVYQYFASLSRDRYENCIELIVPVMGMNEQTRELLLDLMDIYLESHERISFSEGFAFCVGAIGILDSKDLNDYVDDLVEVVEEQREARENILAAVNRFTVPAIFNKFKFKSTDEAVFAFQVFERLSYTSLPPTFFMRYLKVFAPELIDAEVQRLTDEIERDYVGLSRVSVLKSIAESKPASAWLGKANEFIGKGFELTSREWSTGVDSAVRTKNRELFVFSMGGYSNAPDAEPEYFLFHSGRYLITWGDPAEWPAVVAKFELMRKEFGITGKEYLQPWMMVWMIRNAAERWMPTLEDFIEKYMYQNGAIDSKVLSVLCEKYRVSKQTEEIRRVIGRFGSRVKGEGDWALLVLARAYYEVRLPDMAFAQLEDIATRPLAQDLKRRAHSFGVRFSDPRVFELFELN